MTDLRTADDLVLEADRRRARFEATAGRLRRNLNPANLLDEFARDSGLRDVTPAQVVDFAARRHPLITAAAGVGVGVLAFSAIRAARSPAGDIARRDGSIRATINGLTRSAGEVFRARIDARRETLFDAAKAHVAAGAAQLSDAIEAGLDDFVADIPAAPPVRPAVETTIQLILLLALEAIMPEHAHERRRRDKPSRRSRATDGKSQILTDAAALTQFRDRARQRPQVAPGGALLRGLAQQIGGMKHRQRPDRAAVHRIVEPLPARARDAFLQAEQSVGGRGAETDQHRRARQVRSAGG